MTIDRRTIARAVIALTIWGAYASRCEGQQGSESRSQLPAVIKYDEDMASMLAHLTEIYGATIGLEIDPQHNVDEREAINPVGNVAGTACQHGGDEVESTGSRRGSNRKERREDFN